MLQITYSDRFQKHFKKLSDEEKKQFKNKRNYLIALHVSNIL